MDPQKGYLLLWRSCWFLHIKMHFFSLHVLHKRVHFSKPFVFTLQKAILLELICVCFFKTNLYFTHQIYNLNLSKPMCF